MGVSHKGLVSFQTPSRHSVLVVGTTRRMYSRMTSAGNPAGPCSWISLPRASVQSRLQRGLDMDAKVRPLALNGSDQKWSQRADNFACQRNGSRSGSRAIQGSKRRIIARRLRTEKVSAEQLWRVSHSWTDERAQETTVDRRGPDVRHLSGASNGPSLFKRLRVRGSLVSRLRGKSEQVSHVPSTFAKALVGPRLTSQTTFGRHSEASAGGSREKS